MKFRRSVRLHANQHSLVSPQSRQPDTTKTNLPRTGIVDLRLTSPHIRPPAIQKAPVFQSVLSYSQARGGAGMIAQRRSVKLFQRHPVRMAFESELQFDSLRQENALAFLDCDGLTSARWPALKARAAARDSPWGIGRRFS
jgi:hypothetical protein